MNHTVTLTRAPTMPGRQKSPTQQWPFPYFTFPRPLTLQPSHSNYRTEFPLHRKNVKPSNGNPSASHSQTYVSMGHLLSARSSSALLLKQEGFPQLLQGQSFSYCLPLDKGRPLISPSSCIFYHHYQHIFKLRPFPSSVQTSTHIHNHTHKRLSSQSHIPFCFTSFSFFTTKIFEKRVCICSLIFTSVFTFNLSNVD